MKTRFFMLVAGLFTSTVMAQNTPSLVGYGNDWVATDAVGRTLPSYAEVGPQKTDKYIGVFYWLWHSYIRTRPIRNMTEELRRTNGNPNFVYQDWYWGEPENGYYHNSDPWVIRRHIQLMSDAGIDFVFLDYTNGPIGEQSLDGFMAILSDMKSKGVPVPKVIFFTNDENDRHTLDNIYNNIYKPGKYQEHWFYWEGKPLVMEGRVNATSDEMRNFFTFRDTWAFKDTQEDYWNFVDDYPQRYSTHNGAPEQICVSKSMGAPLHGTGAVNNKGASYTKRNGPPSYNSVWETDRTPYGDFFEEQWSRAHEVNPTFVCITGWNELTAGQWNTNEPALTFMGRRCDDIKWFMVDEFNVEFNRDVEPMKGEHTDNYYYQMVGHIRRHKGMAPPPPVSGSQNITLDGNFSEWSSVTPVMRDMQDDTKARNFQNVDNSGTYTNFTGRNDIVESRVTYNASQVYFYVKCANTITAHTDANWMLLYLDTDRNKGTGWEGYDYVLNAGVNSETQTTVKRWNGNDWVSAGTANYRKNGAEMEIEVANTLINQSGSEVALYFHWNDNPQSLKNIAEFFTNGDSAPDRRFNYAYESKGGGNNPQSPYAGVINLPGTIEAENFDKGGEGIAYHDYEVANQGSAYRQEGVDLQACAEGGYNIGWTVAGEWLEYSVNVATTGSYQFTARVATPYGSSFHIELDGQNVSGVVSAPNTGDWQNWQNTAAKAVNLTAGAHILRLFYDQNDCNINSLSFTGGGGNPAIVSGAVYKIIGKQSGKAIEVNGKKQADSAVIDQWDYLGGANQQWKVESLPGGYYKFTAQHSGKGMAIPNGSVQDGVRVVQWPNAGANWQQWKIDPTSDGYFRITNRTSGKALTVENFATTNGKFIAQKPYNNASNQKWIFTRVDGGGLPSARVENAEELALSSPQLHLSPNPTNALVNLSWEGVAESAVVTVINAQGQFMHQQVVQGTSYQLNTAAFTPGIYVVKVGSGKAAATQKLIIIR